MGATAFQKSLGATHSLSHPVRSLDDLHHGTTSAVLMLHALANHRAAIEAGIARLAGCLRLAVSFGAFLEWILELRREIGAPHTLVELGVAVDRVDLIAATAIRDPTDASNPVESTKEAAREIFDRAARSRPLNGFRARD